MIKFKFINLLTNFFVVFLITTNASFADVLIKGQEDNTNNTKIDIDEFGDISITGEVQINELKFKEVGNTTVKFYGNTQRKLIDKSIRKNLPEKIQPNVLYKNVNVHFQILSLFLEIEDLNINNTNLESKENIRK